MKLNSGWQVFEHWAETATTEQIELVREAMLAIADESWPQRFDSLDDVARPGSQVILIIDADLWLVFRVLTEYREYFNIVYIGPPDDH